MLSSKQSAPVRPLRDEYIAPNLELMYLSEETIICASADNLNYNPDLDLFVSINY